MQRQEVWLLFDLNSFRTFKALGVKKETELCKRENSRLSRQTLWAGGARLTCTRLSPFLTLAAVPRTLTTIAQVSHIPQLSLSLSLSLSFSLRICSRGRDFNDPVEKNCSVLRNFLFFFFLSILVACFLCCWHAQTSEVDLQFWSWSLAFLVSVCVFSGSQAEEKDRSSSCSGCWRFS